MGAREEISEEFAKIAEELQRAAEHCRTTSERFASHDVPSGCAHAFAALGHLSRAQAGIQTCAERHSLFARINDPT